MKKLKIVDPQIAKLIKEEEKRQEEVLEMIASENYTSKAVMEALGSVLTNKYSEGYPRKRYYQGNRVADEVEILAQERAKKLFKVPYVNVQPLSGSPANLAVYFALLEPLKDKIMGLSLAFGGHLTHGQPVSASGKFFKGVLYTLGSDGKLNFDEIEEIAKREKPKIIVCGFTAYPRTIDFKRFGDIADSVGAYLLADVSHIAGLIAAGVHPSPVPYAHIVTTTTHKTLRGPRGAMIMVTQKGIEKNSDLPSLIDSAIIPGLQGGPHDNQTAAIAVALKEADTSEYRKYAKQIVLNCKSLASELLKLGYELISGGTDNHLILLDLRNKNINGAVASLALEAAGIVINKNSVPNDNMPPFYPSGLRIGTAAITTRGLKEKDMKQVALWIDRAIREVGHEELPAEKADRSAFWKMYKQIVIKNKNLIEISREIRDYLKKFPVYS